MVFNAASPNNALTTLAASIEWLSAVPVPWASTHASAHADAKAARSSARFSGAARLELL